MVKHIVLKCIKGAKVIGDSIMARYKIEDEKAVRLNPVCPRCGEGVMMADKGEWWSCGKMSVSGAILTASLGTAFSRVGVLFGSGDLLLRPAITVTTMTQVTTMARSHLTGNPKIVIPLMPLCTGFSRLHSVI